jgi:hypothetical protein
VEIFAEGTDTVSDNEEHSTSMSPDELANNEDDFW